MGKKQIMQFFKNKVNEICLQSINWFVMVENQNHACNIFKLWFNVLQSKEYACVFIQEHQKTKFNFTQDNQHAFN